MDVFATVGTAIDLSLKIAKYINEVKGQNDEQRNLAAAVLALNSVLPGFKDCIEQAQKLDSDAQTNAQAAFAALKPSYDLCENALKEIRDSIEKANPGLRDKYLAFLTQSSSSDASATKAPSTEAAPSPLDPATTIVDDRSGSPASSNKSSQSFLSFIRSASPSGSKATLHKSAEHKPPKKHGGFFNFAKAEKSKEVVVQSASPATDLKQPPNQPASLPSSSVSVSVQTFFYQVKWPITLRGIERHLKHIREFQDQAHLVLTLGFGEELSKKLGLVGKKVDCKFPFSAPETGSYHFIVVYSTMAGMSSLRLIFIIPNTSNR